MRAIEAVIFDMDGTLVDSEGVSRRAWSLAADELGVDLPDAFIDSLMGRNSRACNSLIVEHLGGNKALAKRVVDMHLELFLKLAETDLKLKPGAREALEALRSAGLPLAVATSTACARPATLGALLADAVFHIDYLRKRGCQWKAGAGHLH